MFNDEHLNQSDDVSNVNTSSAGNVDEFRVQHMEISDNDSVTGICEGDSHHEDTDDSGWEDEELVTNT